MVVPSLLAFPSLGGGGWLLRLARGAGSYTSFLRGGVGGRWLPTARFDPPNNGSLQACSFYLLWKWMAAFPRLAVDAWPCRCGRHSYPPDRPIALQSITRDAAFSQLAMARRNVRRSVRTKSRTDQVCGAKQRQGRAVYPALEQKATIHFLYPFLPCAFGKQRKQPRPSLRKDV